jgi:putative transposase
VRANRDKHRVATMCRVLGVSPSGYYAWRARPASRRAQHNAELLKQVRVAHADSDGTYGAPRVYRELREQGVLIGRKRIRRLMRSAGLQGVSRRKHVRTTVRDERKRPAPDLVERDFSASAANRLWVADITYIPTWTGFSFLAVVLDV